MRQIIFLLITAIIGLACGPKITETIAGGPKLISIAGHVMLYGEVIGDSIENVWVVIGTPGNEAFSGRTDSALTDSTGAFAFDSVLAGELFYELYMDPRIDCYGGVDTMVFNSDVTNALWFYTMKPGCHDTVTPE